MAVKPSYKIPASLDANHLSMEITLQNKEGIGLKPLSLATLGIWVGAFFILLFVVMRDSSPIAQAGIGMKILFSIVWVAFVFAMTKKDKAHQMRLELIPSLLSYLSSANRTVLTRRSNNASPFLGIVNIESIDDDTGVVHYSDGTFGYWFSVVGSASVLLFPEDKDLILNKVDDFYKKFPTDCEVIFITAKESQKVARQQAHLVAQRKALGYKDPDNEIGGLFLEQFNVLKNFVGNEFKSIHQYMILKADDREALSVMNNIVRGECENSSLVFKECEPLYRKDIERILKSIYAREE